MDPLAHTLFGATLAEAGLKRKTALATATLIIGANIPDVDAVATFISSDYALLVRRGWTHEILALLIWPFLLTGMMLGIDSLLEKRRQRKGRERSGPALNPAWMLGIAFIGVWSHPLLDWLNTYGVRFLMPFDGSWFYGDTLFIIDPWFWLLVAAGVVLARSSAVLSMGGWLVLGMAVTALITTTEFVPFAAKIVWGAGVAGIVIARLTGRFQNPDSARKAAFIMLISALLYMGFMYTGSRMTVSQAKSQLTAQGIETTDVLANPLPAQVLARTGVAATESHYHFFYVNFLQPESFTFTREPIAIEPPDEVVRAALELPEIQGMRNWLRLPHYESVQTETGWRVYIRDLRYVEPDQTTDIGIGLAIIELDEELRYRSQW